MNEPNPQPSMGQPVNGVQDQTAHEAERPASERLNLAPPANDDRIASSVTPPPAVQPQMHAGNRRSRQLYSPPTTAVRQINEPRISYAKEEDNSNGSVAELCAVIQRMQLELNEARTTTAHFKLQYNMLRMDSAEMQNRMMVELDMAQREIEVLQAAEERRKHELLSPTLSQAAATTANATMINELSQERTALIEERDDLARLLGQAQREIEKKDGVIAGQDELIDRLRGRIRMNREHVNGLLDNIYENTAASPASWLNTPMRRPNSQYTTPRSNLPQRNIMMPTSQPRENHNFDALLLADKFINRGAGQPPSTPSRSSAKRQHAGHVRGAHSMTSIPTTPRRQIIPASRILQTPPQSSAMIEPPSSTARSKMSSVSRPTKTSLAAPVTPTRRASSDSTIDAASDEERVPVEKGDLSVQRTPSKAPEQLSQQSHPDEVIPESQATQAAMSMLRRTPVKSGGSFSAINSMSAPAKTAATNRKDYSQTKLTGRIAKPGPAIGSAQQADAEKRRMTSYSADVLGSPTKKTRTTNNVGLGIGLCGSPR